MVTLVKIYTKTGDLGETGLGDGSRISKAVLRISAIGAVDEANSAIGIARLDARRRDRTPCWRASRTICSIWAPTFARRKMGERLKAACGWLAPRSSGWSARSTR